MTSSWRSFQTEVWNMFCRSISTSKTKRENNYRRRFGEEKKRQESIIIVSAAISAAKQSGRVSPNRFRYAAAGINGMSGNEARRASSVIHTP